MCFSMRRTDVCPVEERRILRKSAFCTGDVTGKRILQVGPHGKAHFAYNELGPRGGAGIHAPGAHAPEVARYQKTMSSGPIFVSLSFSKRRARPCSGSRR